MIIRLSTERPAQVEAGDVLTELSVRHPASMTAEQLAVATDELVEEVDGDHAWLVLAELRNRAGHRADPDWHRRFSGMVDYARSSGWVSDDGRLVRAHLEAEPAP